MTGKGSKQRPLATTQSEFDQRWDLIFGGKNMKRQNDEKKLSRYMSVNGKREATVSLVDGRFVIEFYEQSRYVSSQICDSENQADDIAENYSLGIQ